MAAEFIPRFFTQLRDVFAGLVLPQKAGTVAVLDDMIAVQTFSNADATIASTSRRVYQTGTMAAARTAYLPRANSVLAGTEILVADISGSVTATNKITVARSGSDTINGGTSEDIMIAYGWRRFISDGSSKWLFDAGILRSSKNLSDLASASAARGFLGVGATGDLLFTAANISAAMTALGRAGLQYRSTDSSAVTSNTTLASDSQIGPIALDANTTYSFEVFILATVGAGGLKAQIILPSVVADATTSVGKCGTRVYWGQSFATPVSVDSTGNNIQLIADSSATTKGIYVTRGMFRTGATPGNADFKWAQNASNAAGSQILAGSYVEITKKF